MVVHCLLGAAGAAAAIRHSDFMGHAAFLINKRAVILNVLLAHVYLPGLFTFNLIVILANGNVRVLNFFGNAAAFVIYGIAVHIYLLAGLGLRLGFRVAAHISYPQGQRFRGN